MSDQTDTERAERFTARRARVWPVLGFAFIAQQTAYFSGHVDTGRTVDHLRISAWMALSIVLLAAVMTGGGFLLPKRVRALANDEGTRAHHLESTHWGFFAAMLASLGLYFFSLFEPLTGREAVHTILTSGIAVALVRFGMLERRAFKSV